MAQRQLDKIPDVRSRMHSASPQQWNIIELLHIAGPYVLRGKWREQRAVRSLIKRGILEPRPLNIRPIIAIQFTPYIQGVIASYEAL